MDIVWREVAIDGLERARSYIAQHNPAAAERIWQTIIAAVGRLTDRPNLGRPAGSRVRVNSLFPARATSLCTLSLTITSWSSRSSILPSNGRISFDADYQLPAPTISAISAAV